jgi:hypothetical protein
MERAIIFLVIPTGIGWAIDKMRKQDGPGWFFGLMIGVALYGLFGGGVGGY